MSRAEHSDLQGHVAKIEAENIILRADIVEIRGQVGIVVHSLEGDGVEGIEQRVKDIEIFLAAAPERAKASRSRRWIITGIIVGLVVGITGLISGIVTWVGSLLRGVK